MKLKQKREEGISLRTTNVILVIGAVIITSLLFYSTYHLSVSFRNLTDTSEEQIEMRKAARELMDASDYLTEKVQRFTVNGDMRFLDEYFNEAFEANHREEALSTMAEGTGNTAALSYLQTAMAASVDLMDLEYYAMKLVIEAKGYTDYPDVLKDVELTGKDEALSPEEKMRRANELVLSDNYYEQKDKIRENMRKLRREFSGKEEASSLIAKKLMSMEEFIMAGHVCIYMSAFGEVDTKEIISFCLECGKKVSVPKSLPDGNLIIGRYSDETKKGMFGIDEPLEFVPVGYGEPDVIIVPGIAFDKCGTRLGFGKGYYDRFLKATRGFKIALAYDFQLTDELPKDEHDVKMDAVVTENEILYF